jgi:hypothetical protein
VFDSANKFDKTSPDADASLTRVLSSDNAAADKQRVPGA